MAKTQTAVAELSGSRVLGPKPRATPHLVRFFRHPISALFWFTVISLIVREQYPFSHYPMYSGFSSKTYYFYLAGEGGQPIKAKRIFKKSIPKMKKLYAGYMKSIKRVERPSDDAEAMRHAITFESMI